LTAKRETPPTEIIHDRDTKFTARFDERLKEAGILPKLLPIRSPNLNARIERFVQTIKIECLDHFIVFGTDHLDHLVSEFVQHYNEHRAHSNRGHLPAVRQQAPEEWTTIDLEHVVCRERLGGVLKSYERRAA
jgi:putative transposase